MRREHSEMYIKYYLQNVEKLRITNDSSSHNEQMDTLNHIVGTTIRGVIINRIINRPVKDPNLKNLGIEVVKKQLLDPNCVRYMNAYPVIEKKRKEEKNVEYVELIPSVKGFYEDKEYVEGRKKIENVLFENVSSGSKRANVGKFCEIENECLQYMSPALGSDLRINTGQSEERPKTIFRGEYIEPGQIFCGFIEVKSPELCDIILTAFEDKNWYIGNSKSAGYGACKIISVKKIDEIPYYQYLPAEDCSGYVYLYLTSNTAMRNENGEYIGLDLKWLADQLGVADIEIEACAASTIQVCGYNRLWKTKIPSVTMYEMGSVFKLSFPGIMKKEKIDQLCGKGIGVQRNEGFGNVLILANYEMIHWKEKINTIKKIEKEQISKPEEDKRVLKIAAKGYYYEQLEKAKTTYLLNVHFPGQRLNSSQLGSIRTLAIQLRYQPEMAKEKILNYLANAVTKDESARVHNLRTSREPMQEFVRFLLQVKLSELLQGYWADPKAASDEIMTIPVNELLKEDEILTWKLQLLADMIQIDNRVGGVDDETV